MSGERGVFRKIVDFDPLPAAKIAGFGAIGSGISSGSWEVGVVGAAVVMGSWLVESADLRADVNRREGITKRENKK